MKLHRFIGAFALAQGPLEARDSELRNQLANVLRIAPGETVLLCDGAGNEAEARVVEYGKATVAFDVGEVRRNGTEPATAKTLYVAVLKRENFELVVQKATELGIASIVPLVTRRTVKLGVRPDRLAKIAREAAEQSGRGVVPIVAEPMPFAHALGAVDSARAILFDASGKHRGIADISKTFDAAFIGPEGGWDPEEVAEAHAVGLTIGTLGPRTLRAETAAIIAAHLLTA